MEAAKSLVQLQVEKERLLLIHGHAKKDSDGTKPEHRLNVPAPASMSDDLRQVYEQVLATAVADAEKLARQQLVSMHPEIFKDTRWR